MNGLNFKVRVNWKFEPAGKSYHSGWFNNVNAAKKWLANHITHCLTRPIEAWIEAGIPLDLKEFGCGVPAATQPTSPVAAAPIDIPMKKIETITTPGKKNIDWKTLSETKVWKTPSETEADEMKKKKTDHRGRRIGQNDDNSRTRRILRYMGMPHARFATLPMETKREYWKIESKVRNGWALPAQS